MLQNTSNRICANHGKKMLFGKKGKVNGVKSIVYEKDGVVISATGTAPVFHSVLKG